MPQTIIQHCCNHLPFPSDEIMADSTWILVYTTYVLNANQYNHGFEFPAVTDLLYSRNLEHRITNQSAHIFHVNDMVEISYNLSRLSGSNSFNVLISGLSDLCE